MKTEIRYIDGDERRKVEVIEWCDIEGDYYGWCHEINAHYFWHWKYVLAHRLKIYPNEPQVES